MLRASFALFRKDLKVSLRDPLFLIISVVVPLVFAALYALVIQVSATNPIAVARQSEGPHSDRFLQILGEMRSVDGPFFEIRTLDPQKASELYRGGEVAGLLIIPPSFDERVADGATGIRRAEVELRVFNINSDATKNLQLRVDHAVRLFQREYRPRRAVEVREQSVSVRDIRITEYLGTALLMFAVIYAAMVNTGALIAREWEQRTVKPAVLSPLGYLPFIAGKWAAALAQTVISTTLVFVALYAILGYPVFGLGPSNWAYLFSFFLFGAALGALLGVVLQKSLAIVPICVIVAVTHFFLSGYESYMRGFAHGGALEWVWRFSSLWPLSALTDRIRFDASGVAAAEPVFAWVSLGWTLFLISALTALTVIYLSRQLTFEQGQ